MYNKALCWLLNHTDTEYHGRLARWILRLSELTFDIFYKRGAAKKISDAISRLPMKGESKVVPDEGIPFHFSNYLGTYQEVVTGSKYDECMVLAEGPELIPVTMEQVLLEQGKYTYCQGLIREA